MKLLKLIKNQQIIFLITIVISAILHISIFFFRDYYIFKKNLKKLHRSSHIPLVVDLSHLSDTRRIQNVDILSKNNQKGRGRLKPESESLIKRQHIVGKTHHVIIDAQYDVTTPNQNQNIIKKKNSNQKKKSKQTRKDKESLKKKKEKLKTKDIKKIKKKKNVKTGLETINSFTMQFDFDESNLKKVGVNAYMDSDFINNLGKIFSKQLKAYFISHSQNFFFLKNDKVAVLATIDNTGKISFVDYLKQSSEQDYMNYLIKKMVDDPETLSHLPSVLKIKNQEYIHLTVEVSYTGAPLYHVVYTIGH